MKVDLLDHRGLDAYRVTMHRNIPPHEPFWLGFLLNYPFAGNTFRCVGTLVDMVTWHGS
jgi:hypothetical protein